MTQPITVTATVALCAAAQSDHDRINDEAAQRLHADAAARGQTNVLPMPTKAPAAPGAMLRLGQINERLAPFAVDASALAAIGFPHVKTEGAAKLWNASDFPRIVAGIVAHLQTVQMKEAA